MSDAVLTLPDGGTVRREEGENESGRPLVCYRHYAEDGRPCCELAYLLDDVADADREKLEREMLHGQCSATGRFFNRWEAKS